MEKIAIIGASGFVGSALTNEALARGYEVTALVRHPDKVEARDNLVVLPVDVFNTKDLEDTIRGFETVISAYNPGWKNPEIVEQTRKGYASIIEAAKKSNVKRLLIVGGAGSLYVGAGTMLMDTEGFPDKMKPAVEALAEVYIEQLPKEKELDWVFFSPAAELKHGERTGHYTLGRDNVVLDVKGDSVISVEDYAKAMIDEAEYPEHHRERFTIGYREV